MSDVIIQGSKTCSKCKNEKPETIEYFGRLKDGYQSWCKECKNQNYFKNKDKISIERREQWRKSHPVEQIEKGYKKCCKCKEIKPKTDIFFHSSKNTKDGFKHSCKVCRNKEYISYSEQAKVKSKQRYKIKKNEILEKEKKYREKRADKYKEYSQKYYKKNKEEIKAKVKFNFYRRIEEDIGFKILQRCRTRIYKAIKGTVKSNKTRELIGCSVEKLLLHIEQKFKTGMTWDNYGEWHIDHIKPCAAFDFTLERDQLECFHYTNLQPLWAQENMSKSSKF